MKSRYNEITTILEIENETGDSMLNAIEHALKTFSSKKEYNITVEADIAWIQADMSWIDDFQKGVDSFTNTEDVEFEILNSEIHEEQKQDKEDEKTLPSS